MSYTEQELLSAIDSIRALLEEGWSIPYARSKVCGTASSGLNRAISARPEYQALLMSYMRSKGLFHNFVHDGNSLRMSKKLDSKN